jgi:hypothetical protein
MREERFRNSFFSFFLWYLGLPVELSKNQGGLVFPVWPLSSVGLLNAWDQLHVSLTKWG